MNFVKKYEDKQLAAIQADKNIPEFSPGDTVKVNVRIREGNTERVQAYEGVCIARAGKDINATFTVRKISYGEGVERVFPLWSPRIESIELVRRGSVRRAKLYYLRDRRGKSARIAERISGHGIEKKDLDAPVLSKTEKAKAKKEAKRIAREENRIAAEKAKADKIAAKEAEAAAKAAEAEAGAAEE
ncbi:MAG: 50S ribosomal protein L19 [Alphaproteobacteria bacterium]|nr:50S ribosomal protein L19 [Alphaproteobacteria bacterium]|tara:strand:- start:34647 stop:35207 length:561 start_codon:yes stop_codon:yes gene_type:complete